MVKFPTSATLYIVSACVVLAGAAAVLVYSFQLELGAVQYDATSATASSGLARATSTETENEQPVDRVRHLETPEAVRAVYMTTCAASTPSFRHHLVDLIETTELNAIVIDIKDYSGGISFPVNDPELKAAQGINCFVPDMKDFIASLHERDIYVIGRITVFQDPFYARRNPHIAVQTGAGAVWRDYKGLSFTDPGARKVWDYTVRLSRESYDIGFDELNYDYIRFPSDGNMKDIVFPVSGERPKDVVVEEFFAYLHEQVNDPEVFPDSAPVTSADLFGMVTTNYDHLGIGQVLERALPYFDYIAPMVYPSHYPNGFNGWGNPNHYPYDVIRYTMSRGVARAVATSTNVYFNGAERIGTSTPAVYKKEAYDKDTMRPWLQDFDYGGDYGPEEVRGQIQATYDAGLDSWMLWDPGNRYTREALKPASASPTPTIREEESSGRGSALRAN
ncbi:MAG: putative glycoside hydrolase [Candidatus Paceibacterota bacterium]